MKFSLFLLSLLVVLISAEQWSKESNCHNLTNDIDDTDTSCLTRATWRRDENGECIESTYYKETVNSTRSSVGPMNGIAQCVKSRCDTNDIVATTCEDAFGSRLSELH